MKKFHKVAMFALLCANMFAALPAKAEPMCQVHICNKLSRFSLDPFSHLKDYLGKTCFDTSMPKSQAVAGKTLSSESRWYQGSFNPTKKSVTYIDSVGRCSGS